MRLPKHVWSTICFFSIISSLLAQDIDLVGRTGWSFYGRRWLELYAERIENNRGSFTGPLYLRVRATAEPSLGDFTSSYLIGSLRLGQLSAGNDFVNVDRLAFYAPPPAGLYYTSMTIEEATSSGYEVVDYADLDGIVNFGGVGQGAAQGMGSNGDLNFTGAVSWESANGRVTISAESINNERATRSKPLRLGLYATTTPFDGGVLQGQLLATRTLARLKPGISYQGLAVATRFRPPFPEGDYYTVLTLEERVGFRWTIVDYVVFPDVSTF